MRSFNFFLLTVFCFTAINCTALENEQQNPETEATSNNAAVSYKRYGVEQGMVEYELSGAKTGKQSLYFIDWGMKEAKYETGEIKMMSITVKENRLNILDGEWTYGIDLDKNTGTKMKTPLLEELVENSKSGDLTDVGEDMLKKMGGRKIGQENILGKNCDIWEVKSVGTKTWVWNYVPLKTETIFMGQTIKITATKVDFNTSIPADKFKIPSDVTITEGLDVKSLLDKMKGGKKN
jgi:outer membrane lipoprotein-sorting protein